MHSMAKVVHDKVSPVTGQGMKFNCEGSVNAIAVNKDCSFVVAVGRAVFRIISIEDDMFKERANLSVGRVNHNYAAADVSWNHNDESMLASAATNGHVVIWDLNKNSRSKQEHVFSDHKRSVHRVNFHSFESNLLLSGSQDGTMMLFDVRKRSVSLVFAGKSLESVRDVQWCPSSHFNFGAAYENGNVQIWDMRRPERCEKQFTAHSGPVFSLDWHPDEKFTVATAGRDKMIKVWDVQKMHTKLQYSVQTIASVGRIKWRPQRKNQIASAALILDHTVNVWDLKRPYIPFATFDEHTDLTTCIVWKNDPHIFLTSGKDDLIIQHVFKDAKRPADLVVPAGIDMSIDGHISHAYAEKQGSNNVKASSSSRLSLFKKVPDRSVQFAFANSSLSVFETQTLDEVVSMRWFVEAALRYRLKGSSLEDLCNHNANVAQSLNLTRVANTWRMLQIMHCSSSGSNSHPSNLPSRTTSVTAVGADKQEADKALSKQPTKPAMENTADNLGNDHDTDKVTDITSGNSDSDSEGESSELEKVTDIASRMASRTGDFFFGDGELDLVAYSLDAVSSMDNMEDWTLPSEAFQPRHELTAHATPPEIESSHDDMMNHTNNSDFISLHPPSESEDQDLLVQVKPVTSSWSMDFSHRIANMLKWFAEQGDVQSPVCMLIVLGGQVKHIEEQMEENWFMSYIDLLGRFKLWTKANEVIKLSSLPQVYMLNQQSTVIHTACSRCNRPMHRAGWLCDRCKVVLNLCSICHLPVKGLFAWCQGCCHGGHLKHIEKWLTQSRCCPAGCGHLCEYT
ncbi:GATOR complex protein WDR24-like [Gigantopelta aegis]|uniref:GATOR complex protein WDR24-like n=1 Tax=Gigantopelta aegis TaxID=1735272 RepID=UPI001B88AE15|nr:GATOR complex protein WDR24-like [Gigantopelta aegis]